MTNLEKALLEELGALVFGWASLRDNSEAELHQKWDDAFKDDGTPFVVVVFTHGDYVFIIDSVKQLYEEQRLVRFYSLSYNIDSVVRIPKDVWERVLPRLNPDKVHDLTVLTTPA